MSKIILTFLLKTLIKIVKSKQSVPTSSRVSTKHSTIDQVCHITNVIERSLERNKVYPVVFLDDEQDFGHLSSLCTCY